MTDFLASVMAKALVMLIEALVTRLVQAAFSGALARGMATG